MSSTSDKRTDIIDSSKKVFTKNGYYKSTIEDIASEAGVGKGTVYLYFSGKEELFEEMLKNILCEYYDSIISILSKDESVEIKINNLIEFYKTNIKEQLDLVQAVMGEYDPMSSEKVKDVFKEKKKELNFALNDFIISGIEKGEIREDIDIDIASFCILAIVEKYYLDRMHRKELDLTEIKDGDLIKFLIEMMK